MKDYAFVVTPIGRGRYKLLQNYYIVWQFQVLGKMVPNNGCHSRYLNSHIMLQLPLSLHAVLMMNLLSLGRYHITYALLKKTPYCCRETRLSKVQTIHHDMGLLFTLSRSSLFWITLGMHVNSLHSKSNKAFVSEYYQVHGLEGDKPSQVVTTVTLCIYMILAKRLRFWFELV